MENGNHRWRKSCHSAKAERVIPMESPVNLIHDVESFIHDLDSGNVVVLDKAEEVEVFELGEKNLFGKETKKKKGGLRSVLGVAIAEYRANAYHPSLRWQFARMCYCYIELARTNHVLDYPNLSKKAQQFDELQKEYEKLKSDHIKLLKSFNEIAKEKEKLEKDNKILHAFDSKNNKHKDGFSESGGMQKS